MCVSSALCGHLQCVVDNSAVGVQQLLAELLYCILHPAVGRMGTVRGQGWDSERARLGQREGKAGTARGQGWDSEREGRNAHNPATAAIMQDITTKMGHSRDVVLLYLFHNVQDGLPVGLTEVWVSGLVWWRCRAYIKDVEYP